MPEMAQAVKKTAVKKEKPVSHVQGKESFQSISSPVENILFLQRKIGNQAVQRLIKNGTMQAKLRVGPPGDKYEKEADRVAQQVAASGNVPAIQLAAAQSAQTLSTDEVKTRAIQRKTESLSGASDASTYDFLRKLNSGQPMKHSTRNRLESGMGVDLSNVKVHNDSQAHETASALNARAFTYQNNIWLGRGESQDNINLMAHEATHLVQQQDHSISKMPGGIVASNPPTAIQHVDGAIIQRSTDNPEKKKGNIFQRGWTAIEKGAEAVAEFIEEKAWNLLNKYAPELVPIVQKGIFAWLEEKITSAIDTVFNTLMAPVRTVSGVVQSVSAHFSSLLAWMEEAAVRISKGDCSSISQAAEMIQKVIEGIASPIIDRVKNLASKVGNFFTGLWDRFGVPAWDFLKQVGGWAWEKIQQLGTWIWDKTAPIRNAMKRAWVWIKNKLGIGEGPEGQDGILQWVKRKATDLWDEKIKPFVIRFKKPLMVIGGVLAMLSPAGPILAIGAGVIGLIKGIRWISQNLSKPKSVVEQQGILKGVIIPGLLGAVNSVKTTLTKTAAMITGALGKVMGGFGEFIAAVGGSVLNFLVNAVQWLIDQFQGLVAWANEKVTALVDAISSGLDSLREFLKPVFEVLEQIAEVVSDIMSLPSLVLGKLWNIIPACIRNPFVNFLINQILMKIPIFKEIIEVVPAIWGAIKETALAVIRKVFKEGDLKGAALEVLKLVLRALNVPVELFKAVFAKAGAAINLVVQNPIGFLMNLLEAIKTGLFQFGGNILSHLASGLKNWLFGAVTDAGLHPPEDFSLKSVFNFLLEALDITVEKVLKRLEEKIGKEKVAPIRRTVGIISKFWDWVGTLLKEGPAGVWNKLKEKLGDLWGILIGGISGWITKNVTILAFKKLATTLAGGPVGVVVQGLITLYKAVQSLIKYAKQMLEIVESVLDNIANIASGSIGTAANMVENSLEKALTVALGFLANQLGMGDLSEKIKEIIEVVRDKVVEGIDWLIEKALAVGGALIGMVKGAAAKVMSWWKEKREFKLGKEKHNVLFHGEGASAEIFVETTPEILDSFLKPFTPKAGPQTVAYNMIISKKKVIDDIKKKTGGSYGKEDGETIRDALSEIAKELPKLGTDPVPETKVEWDESKKWKNDVIGSEMTANPLSINPGILVGSKPQSSEESALWKQVNRRKGAYKQGHLLNHHVHGPGIKKNLVPITGSLNTTMESQFESDVKNIVLSENRVINYTVKATFNQPARKYLKEESLLPDHLYFIAFELIYNRMNGKWEESKIPLFSRSLKNELPDDTDADVEYKPVNLSTDTAKHIEENIIGIGPIKAALIEKLRKGLKRPFNFYKELAKAEGIGDETVEMLKKKKNVQVK